MFYLEYFEYLYVLLIITSVTLVHSFSPLSCRLYVAGFIFVLFFKMSLKFVSSIEKHLNKKLQEILNTNNLFPFVNFSRNRKIFNNLTNYCYFLLLMIFDFFSFPSFDCLHFFFFFCFFLSRHFFIFTVLWFVNYVSTSLIRDK